MGLTGDLPLRIAFRVYRRVCDMVRRARNVNRPVVSPRVRRVFEAHQQPLEVGASRRLDAPYGLLRTTEDLAPRQESVDGLAQASEAVNCLLAAGGIRAFRRLAVAWRGGAGPLGPRGSPGSPVAAPTPVRPCAPPACRSVPAP